MQITVELTGKVLFSTIRPEELDLPPRFPFDKILEVPDVECRLVLRLLPVVPVSQGTRTTPYGLSYGLTRRSLRCRGIPRGCVEVGRDHGGLKPRKPKSEEE